MAPVKSVVARSLRSKLVTSTPQIVKTTSRGITATSKNATSLNNSTTQQQQSSTAFIPSDFLRPSPSSYTPNPRFPVQHNTQETPFTSLLNALTTSLTTSARPSLPTLHSLLRDYTSDSRHWSKYALANPDKQYTRNLVCEVPGVFNLLLLVWTPGKQSPIHDHADAHVCVNHFLSSHPLL